MLLALLLACVPDPPSATTDTADTAAPDGDTAAVDSADSADTADSSEPEDTGDTADSGEPDDTAPDTADTADPCGPEPVDLPEDVANDGVDADGDGDDDALHHYVGDLSFDGDASCDMATFCATYDAVRGDVTIWRPETPDLTDLSCLREVTGDLGIGYTFWSGAGTTLVGLESLERVGGTFTVAESPVSFAPLVSLASVGGDVHLVCDDYGFSPGDLTGLDALASIGGELRVAGCHVAIGPLPALTSLGGIDVAGAATGSAAIAAIDGLEGVAALDALSIEDAEVGSLAGLAGLRDLGALRLAQVSGLASLTGLEGIADIPGDVVLEGIVDLASLDGLAGLAHAGSFSLTKPCVVVDSWGDCYDADGVLADLAGLEALAEVDGDLAIGERLGLTSYDGLDTLARVGGTLSVGAEDAEVDGFPVLEEVGGLTVSTGDCETDRYSYEVGCSFGTDAVDGFAALRRIRGDLLVDYNGDLVDLAGLYGVESVDGDFTFRENEFLPVAEVEALRDTIGVANIAGTVTIE